MEEKQEIEKDELTESAEKKMINSRKGKRQKAENGKKKLKRKNAENERKKVKETKKLKKDFFKSFSVLFFS